MLFPKIPENKWYFPRYPEPQTGPQGEEAITYMYVTYFKIICEIRAECRDKCDALFHITKSVHLMELYLIMQQSKCNTDYIFITLHWENLQNGCLFVVCLTISLSGRTFDLPLPVRNPI